MIKKILKENYKYIITMSFLMIFFYIIKKVNNFAIFNNVDNYMKILINNIFNKDYYTLFNIVSDILGIYLPIAILICMLVKFKKKIYFKLQAIGYFITLFVTSISKVIIKRQRPIIEVIATIDKYSFPSGHTLMAFVFYYLLAFLLSKNTDKNTTIAYYLIATILFLTTAISRLYLGVHHFTDIVGSIIIGSIIIHMMQNIVKKNFERKLV